MVKVEYEIIDIDEQESCVGVNVRYWVDGVKGITQFSFGVDSFYDEDSNWKKIVEDSFKRMKSGLEKKEVLKFKKEDVVGKKVEL